MPEAGHTIAIDGPAASGKTRVGRSIACKLGYWFLDTGTMYRAVTLSALNEQICLSDAVKLTALTKRLIIDFVSKGDNDRLLVNGSDVTDKLRNREVDQNVSKVSAFRGVRNALVSQQQKIGNRGSIVMVGRDIGTVVLPQADLKVYLDATVDVRANRRYLEANTNTTSPTTFQNIRADLVDRDRIDTNREMSPLVPAGDAFVLDTNSLSIEQVVATILNRLRRD